MKQAGPTLIELLVVVTIISLLFAMTLLSIDPQRVRDETLFVQPKEHLNPINNSMEAYHVLHNGEYSLGVDCGIPSALVTKQKSGNWPHTARGTATTYDSNNM